MNSPPSDAALGRRLDAEQAQAQLELKDRALAASAEGITIADARLPDQPLIYVNEGFERLTGYSVSEVLGRNCRFLQGPGTDAATVDALRTAVRERRAVTVQLLNYRKDGTPFWNRLSITPVQDASGAVTHFIGVQSDVTAEKEARAALEAANQRLQAASESTKRDLQAAAALQRALLPGRLPSFPGMQLAWRVRPCSDVGGDSLNVIPLDERHVALYILDVSGHGVAAALLSVTLTHMLSVIPDRSFSFRSAGHGSPDVIASPAEVVARLNERFVSSPGAVRFFTIVYGILDQQTWQFTYVAAGHMAPIRTAPDGSREIGEIGGIPVGLIPHATWEEHVMQLAPGDRLYFCTDGIFEAEDGAEQEFGVPRLLESVSALRDAGLAEAVSSLMSQVEAWTAPRSPEDDASLLVIERVAG